MHNAETKCESREPNAAWYVLHTRYQHEKNVAVALNSKSFEVFLPLYTAIHRWKDRRKQISLPLFPCYVFVQSAPDRWLPILSTPGVHNVVGFGGAPSIVPSSEIEAVRKMTEGPLKAEPHPFLQCGDRVRLMEGPLRGLEGLLVRKKSLWKLVVSVEMLQRSVAVEVDSSMVERVHVPPPRFAPPFSLIDSVA
jgi:transcription antitermination factor NusG